MSGNVWEVFVNTDTVLIRNVHWNKRNTPEKLQIKQDDSGKIVNHEIKSLISIVYTGLLF